MSSLFIGVSHAVRASDKARHRILQRSRRNDELVPILAGGTNGAIPVPLGGIWWQHHWQVVTLAHNATPIPCFFDKCLTVCSTCACCSSNTRTASS